MEHIYAKIGASSRAAAAMFAMQHGLLPEDEIAVPVQYRTAGRRVSARRGRR